MYDWNEQAHKLNKQVERGQKFKTIVAAADYLGIPQSTVRMAFHDGRLSYQNTIGVDVPAPIRVNVEQTAYAQGKTFEDRTIVLFITDVHAGFVTDPETGVLVPVHSREFLADLVKITMLKRPDVIVFGGDMLDFPDFSRYDDKPGTTGHIQEALLEVAFIIGKLKLATHHNAELVYLEGNHEVRLIRSLQKHIPSIVSLPSTSSLYPAVSVPNLLGLEELGVHWIGNYPDGQYWIGNVVFRHGDIVRSNSGSTATSIANDTAVSTFYGHIHRTELIKKSLRGFDKTIWVGCPGCACVKGLVPGSTEGSNWQLGAFIVEIDNEGEVINVELVTKADSGSVVGLIKIIGTPYVDELIESIPKAIGRKLK